MMFGDESGVRPMMEDDDEEDYVPESLRGFLEEANKKMESDLEQVMNFDTDYMEPRRPREVPDPNAYDYENEEEDKEFFEQILAKEKDEELKASLLEGLDQDMPPALADESADFMSPSLSDLTATTNPAADLTASAAKRMATEGMSPAGVNLQSDFEQAQQQRLQPVAEGVAVAPGSPWMSTIMSAINSPPAQSNNASVSLTSQTENSLTYSTATSMVTNTNQAASGYAMSGTGAAVQVQTDTNAAHVQQPQQQTPPATATPMKSPPSVSQPQRETIQSNPPSISPMQAAATPPREQTGANQTSLTEARAMWGETQTPSPARRSVPSRSPAVARMATSPSSRRPIPAEKGMVETGDDHRAISTEAHPNVLAKIRPSPPRQRPSPSPTKKDTSQQTSPPQEGAPTTRAKKTIRKAPTPRFTRTTKQKAETASPPPATSPAQQRTQPPKPPKETEPQATPPPEAKAPAKHRSRARTPPKAASPPKAATRTPPPRPKAAPAQPRARAPTPPQSAPAQQRTRSPVPPTQTAPASERTRSPAPSRGTVSGTQNGQGRTLPTVTPTPPSQVKSPEPSLPSFMRPTVSQTRKASPLRPATSHRQASPLRANRTPSPLRIKPGSKLVINRPAKASDHSKRSKPHTAPTPEELNSFAKNTEDPSRPREVTVPRSPIPAAKPTPPPPAAANPAPKPTPVVEARPAPPPAPPHPIQTVTIRTSNVSDAELPDVQPAVSNDSSSGGGLISYGTVDANTPAPPAKQNAAPKISPRLLMGTASSQAKHEPQPALTVGVRQPNSEPKTTPALSPRLMMQTASSQAKHELQPAQTVRIRQPTASFDSSGRRELTSPDKISSRLLQPTSSSDARVGKEITSVTSSLTTKTVRTKKGGEDGRREATKLRVRQRVEEQKRKQVERDEALRERIKVRQQKQKQRRTKIQQGLDRVRGKRERLEQLERERLEQLQQKIAEKEEKAKQRMAEKENRVVRTTKPKARSSHSRPTIPIAPSFATDSRIRRREAHQKESQTPLACSGDILRKGLRDSSDIPEIQRTSSSGSGLTIPQGPKLATSERHGDKHVATPIRDSKDTMQWRKGLRSASSATPSERQSKHTLTIPQAPKFQEIHKRAPPKSTAEREEEEMEYYNAHPFKAQPVRMNDPGLTPSTQKTQPARPLTIPTPFRFRSEDRIHKSREEPEDKEQNVSFKARPMPDFSSVRNTPLTGRTPTARRLLTTPEPFKLRTDVRASNASTATPSQASKGSDGMFRARPMPDYSKHTPVVAYRQPSRKPPPKEPEAPYQFKARPMPDFAASGPPETISFSATSGAATSTSEQEIEASPQFHARPMPKFDQVSIPVIPRDPSKTRSPPKKQDTNKDLPRVKPFRARKAPDFSKPSIPVKPRSPRTSTPLSIASSKRYISPEANKFHARPAPTSPRPSIPVRQRDPSKLRRSPNNDSPSMKRQRQAESPFRAKPAPKFSPPSIPVRHKNPTKLRSPDSVKRVGDTGMAVRAGWPSSGATSTSSSSSRRLTAAERAAQKSDTKTRVRNRMMARTGGSSKNDELRRSVAESRARVEQIRAHEEAMAGPAANRNSIVASSSEYTSSAYTTSDTDTATKRTTFTSEVTPGEADPRARRSLFTVSTSTSESTNRDLQPAELWPSSSEATTMDASSYVPGHLQMASVAEEERQRQRHQDAIHMAQELQRQAEDELSYHGSITSKDRGKGQNTGHSMDFY